MQAIRKFLNDPVDIGLHFASGWTALFCAAAIGLSWAATNMLISALKGWM